MERMAGEKTLWLEAMAKHAVPMQAEKRHGGPQGCVPTSRVFLGSDRENHAHDEDARKKERARVHGNSQARESVRKAGRMSCERAPRGRFTVRPTAAKSAQRPASLKDASISPPLVCTTRSEDVPLRCEPFSICSTLSVKTAQLSIANVRAKGPRGCFLINQNGLCLLPGI